MKKVRAGVAEWQTQWIQNPQAKSSNAVQAQQVNESASPVWGSGGGSPLPSDLAAIVALWPKLPKKVRKAILLMAGCDNE